MSVVILHLHRAVIAGFWQLQIRIEQTAGIRYRRSQCFLSKFISKTIWPLIKMFTLIHSSQNLLVNEFCFLGKGFAFAECGDHQMDKTREED
jgi:hypothetical protein